MHKNGFVIGFALLIALVTYFDGIPQVWEFRLVLVASLLVVAISLFVRRDLAKYIPTEHLPENEVDTFVENDRSEIGNVQPESEDYESNRT